MGGALSVLDRHKSETQQNLQTLTESKQVQRRQRKQQNIFEG